MLGVVDHITCWVWMVTWDWHSNMDIDFREFEAIHKSAWLPTLLERVFAIQVHFPMMAMLCFLKVIIPGGSFRFFVHLFQILTLRLCLHKVVSFWCWGQIILGVMSQCHGHRWPGYWSFKMDSYMSYIRKNFNYIHHHDINKWYKNANEYLYSLNQFHSFKVMLPTESVTETCGKSSRTGNYMIINFFLWAIKRTGIAQP